MREVDFSEGTVARRWREIKPNFREDVIPWTRNMLKSLLEYCLEEELEVCLRAAPHEQTADRRDHRNGAYSRDLTTELGRLPALQVPRAREACFQPQVFARYQRRCGGRMRLLATLEHPQVIRQIHAHLGLPTEVPSLSPLRPPPARAADLVADMPA